tara:strand:+ start:63 stop:323 length:261 start_codon:yes stop_codon:yes gene_type:complete
LIEVIVSFCIVLVEEARHKGGESICNFYNPGIVFENRKQCINEKKLIEDYVVEEFWKIRPEAVRIFAKGVCTHGKRTGRNKGRDRE